MLKSEVIGTFRCYLFKPQITQIHTDFKTAIFLRPQQRIVWLPVLLIIVNGSGVEVSDFLVEFTLRADLITNGDNS